MHAHHLLDAALIGPMTDRRRDGLGFSLEAIRQGNLNGSAVLAAVQNGCDICKTVLPRAQKFDFGEAAEWILKDHSLIDTFVDYSRHDLFSLPFPEVYFEGKRHSSSGTRFLFCCIAADTRADLRPWRVKPKTTNGIVVRAFFAETGRGDWVDSGVSRVLEPKDEPALACVEIDDPLGVFGSIEPMRHLMIKTTQLLFCGTVALSATAVKCELVQQPARLNKARARAGKSPISDHRVVIIGGVSASGRIVGPGLTRASPRMHWRRGHVRILAPDRKIKIPPCLVGDRARGFTTHDYSVRAAPEV